MGNLEKAFMRIVPHYIIRDSGSVCSCHIDARCDCMPELVLTCSGSTGYGSAFWTYIDETTPMDIQKYHNQAYYCTFLSYSFWAFGETDAAETLRKLLSRDGHAAMVNYRKNARAEDVMKALQAEDANNKGQQ